jgi:aryl-alcohol dehydrogenase-like predicted oxidoreductase
VADHPSIAGIPLVLGGNTFGWTAERDASFAILDAFYAGGGRMIDTADVYSAWIPGHVGGESERFIGQWLESRGVRADMRIHTKTGMLSRKNEVTIGGPGDVDLYQPAEVLRSLDASLERLRTDYLDLYYAHRDYTSLPIEDIVEAFDGAARSGKVRELGASNFTAERLSAALATSAREGLARYVALQPHYNLVVRNEYEGALSDVCAREGVACVPYFALAMGFLSGKYRPGSAVESARGIMALTMDGIAIGNGILTVENEAQAIVRADPSQKDKGGEAAKAAIAMLGLREKFGA